MRKIIIFLIKGYQVFLREVLTVIGLGSDCCFVPSCSEYSRQAINKYGVIKGSLMSIERISRCSFCSEMKHDPLP
jgi:hypothetical protein